MGNVNRKKLILVSAFSAFLFASGIFLIYWLQTPYNWVIKIIGVFVLRSVIELITQKILKSRAMLLALGCVAILGVCTFILILLMNMVLKPFEGNFESINVAGAYYNGFAVFVVGSDYAESEPYLQKKRRTNSDATQKAGCFRYRRTLCRVVDRRLLSHTKSSFIIGIGNSVADDFADCGLPCSTFHRLSAKVER